ncbi:hypothetical protein [Streptomyces ossamyceticus]|jgi:hypothetical protein|uniref:hypothetical protein n=1 Tax=Streptomyces ossamyceticus TaxID=249581 RepID=UPI0006E42E26|nr:hypothetical protein [Streptomyces ossamyceticus]
MRMKRATKRLGVITALVVGPLMLAATPALAASVSRSYGNAYNSGNTVYACDTREDGDGVYAEYWGSGTTHGYVWDGNGSQAGCGSGWVSSLRTFRVCVDDFGSDTCSDRVGV